MATVLDTLDHKSKIQYGPQGSQKVGDKASKTLGRGQVWIILPPLILQGGAVIAAPERLPSREQGGAFRLMRSLRNELTSQYS